MCCILRLCVVLAILVSALPAAAQVENPVVEARRLTNFGVDAALSGLWSEARFRWLQALETFPNFPAAHNNLAVVFEHFGEYSQAREHYSVALELVERNRFILSNNRMFLRFFYQQIQQTRRGEADAESGEAAEAPPEGAPDSGADAAAVEAPAESEGDAEGAAGPGGEASDTISGETYGRVGSARQVLIKHPRRETPMSTRYRRVYIAGFSPRETDYENLNFETTEYLRSELRKHSLYEVIPLEELALPSDEESFYELVDDYEFWRNLGGRVGADLIICGQVHFYDEPSDGFYPYEYRDTRSGDYRTAQLLIQRTAFTIELDLYFHDAATGELVHEESFGQTIVYRGRLELNLQAFFDVMNRVLPRFMDLLVPREHDAIRFLVRG